MHSQEQEAQYRDSRKLAARQRIYAFAEESEPFGSWVIQRLEIEPGAKVLELGCGHGMLWRGRQQWRRNGWELVLTDLSEGMLIEALTGLQPIGRERFVRADAQKIPFADATFDGVIANHMLYHVEDRQRCFAQVRRVLKERGKLYGATNGLDHLREIKQLIERFVPGATPIGHGGWIEAFSLENGQQQLAPHFASVRVERRSSVLHITESNAVMDYVRSIDEIRARLTGDRLKAMRSEVEREIATRGAFVVRTATGLFVADQAGTP